MSIGTPVQGAAIGAVIGPDHSPLFPGIYYTAWLDGSDVVIAMTGLTVLATDFEVIDDYSTNTTAVDAGLCPATVPSKFALMDTAAGDTLMLPPVPVTFSETPAEGDPLSFAAGELKFQYSEA